jgi:hypothetical protein
VPLVDVYLEFLGGRCRPNTVLAAAYDLKVFFTVVGKPPEEVRPADVLAFITAQRTGRADGQVVLQPVDPVGEPAGVSAATVRRRLSIVSGFFAFLQARGDVAANPGAAGAADPPGAVPAPAGCPAGPRYPEAAADLVPGRGGCADRSAAHPPGPGHGHRDGTGRAAPL